MNNNHLYTHEDNNPLLAISCETKLYAIMVLVKLESIR